MSDSKGKPPRSGKTPRVAGEAKNSGRVAFDSRGNPVWEWETSTGVYDRNASTQRIQTLQAKDLALEQTQPVAQHTGLSVEQTGLPGGGANPYDSTPANRRPPSSRNGPAQPFHPARPRAAPGKPISNSLASKYAATHKRSVEARKPAGFWEKLKARFFRR